jgi:hypothetical protein
VPAQLITACKQAWLEEVGNVSVSRTQLQVLDAIRQLPGCSGASSEHLTYDGLFSIDIAVLPGSCSDASSEHLTYDGLFSIDIAVLLPGDKLLAVEVDGRPTSSAAHRPCPTVQHACATDCWRRVAGAS